MGDEENLTSGILVSKWAEPVISQCLLPMLALELSHRRNVNLYSDNVSKAGILYPG